MHCVINVDGAIFAININQKSHVRKNSLIKYKTI